MPRIEATPATIQKVIDEIPPSRSDVASGIAMSAYALACFELFAIATKQHSLGATLISVLALGDAESAQRAIIVTIAALVPIILILASWAAMALSTWRDSIRFDLEKCLPQRAWLSNKPKTTITIIFFSLAAMSAVTYRLLSLCDLMATFGPGFFYVGYIILTAVSAWVIAANTIGLLQSRYLIGGAAIAALIVIVLLNPFGVSLDQVAPLMYKNYYYSPIVPNVVWISSLFLYVVICMRALLAVKMERDADKIYLNLESSEEAPWMIHVPEPGTRLARSAQLFVRGGKAAFVSFVRFGEASIFTLRRRDHLVSETFWLDRQNIVVLDLDRRARGVNGPFDGPYDGKLEVKLNISTERLREMEEVEISVHELISVVERFEPARFRSHIASCVTKIIDEMVKSVLSIVRAADAFVIGIGPKITIQATRAEVRSRKDNNVFIQNTPGAQGASLGASEALEGILEEADSRLQELVSAEAKLSRDAIAAGLAGLTDLLVNEMVSKAAGPRARDVTSEIMRAINPTISVLNIGGPDVIAVTRAKLEAAIGKADDMLTKIREEMRKSADTDADRLGGLLGNPNLPRSGKEALIAGTDPRRLANGPRLVEATEDKESAADSPRAQLTDVSTPNAEAPRDTGGAQTGNGPRTM